MPEPEMDGYWFPARTMIELVTLLFFLIFYILTDQVINFFLALTKAGSYLKGTLVRRKRVKVAKIISGGQTGADQGALEAAKALGIETGGWMPKNFITETGPSSEIATLYNLQEHTGKYTARTFANVQEADGTIRFLDNPDSAGQKITLEAILNYKKPMLDINLSNPLPFSTVRKWLEEHNIKTLNVAGHRESVYPGCREFVRSYLVDLFR